MAYSRGTIARTKIARDLEEIERLVVAEGIEVVVVGLPRTMSGEIGQQAEKVQRFADVLAQRLSVPIEYWDERLTTVAAQRAMREAGASAAARRRSVDAVAAMLILQGYLDHARNLERRGSGEVH